MFIFTIEGYRQTKEILNASIVLLIDNCSIYLRSDNIQLLFDNNVKIIIFSPFLGCPESPSILCHIFVLER
jgi:hypothetical protein